MDSEYKQLSEQYASKQKSYFEGERVEMLQYVPADAHLVLDVGCSSGGFGATLKAKRPNTVVWGIEPSKEACQKAGERLDKAIYGTFGANLPELNDRRFDCIVFNDVLEHLADPVQTLIDSRDYLTANGVIVASIPNILHFHEIVPILITQDWRYKECGILDNTHLRFFTKKSIIRMFIECGYEIVRIEGINAVVTRKYQLANLLFLNHLKDWKFGQFAVVAKVSRLGER